jgi:hypothetical protein
MSSPKRNLQHAACTRMRCARTRSGMASAGNVVVVLPRPRPMAALQPQPVTPPRPAHSLYAPVSRPRLPSSLARCAQRARRRFCACMSWVFNVASTVARAALCRYYELLASSSELRASCRWYMTQSVYKSDKVSCFGVSQYALELLCTDLGAPLRRDTHMRPRAVVSYAPVDRTGVAPPGSAAAKAFNAGFRPAIDERYRNLPAGVLKPSLKPLHLEARCLAYATCRAVRYGPRVTAAGVRDRDRRLRHGTWRRVLGLAVK